MTRKEALRLQAQETALIAMGLTTQEAETLRRASMTLSRWAELECNADVERQADGKVFVRYSTGAGISRPVRIADRETPAIERVRIIARDHGLAWYHQTDPRGCAVYIGEVSRLGARKIEEAYTNLLAVY